MDVLVETDFLELGLHLVVEGLWLPRSGSLAAFSTLSRKDLVRATNSACGYSAAELVLSTRRRLVPDRKRQHLSTHLAHLPLPPSVREDRAGLL